MSLVHPPHRLHHRGKWSSRSHRNPVSHFHHSQAQRVLPVKVEGSVLVDLAATPILPIPTNIHDRLQRDTRLQRTKDPSTSSLKLPRLHFKILIIAISNLNSSSASKANRSQTNRLLWTVARSVTTPAHQHKTQVNRFS